MRIENFDISVIYTRSDGSYVINQGSYHVPNEGEWCELWQQIEDYVRDHPEVVMPEPGLITPEPTPEEQEKELQLYYTRLIQRHLDETAYAYGYTGIDEGIPGACNSVCTYENTGVQKFDDEGKAFKIWRSAVWAKGYEILDLVKKGAMPIPTEQELIAMLPKLEVIYTA